MAETQTQEDAQVGRPQGAHWSLHHDDGQGGLFAMACYCEQGVDHDQDGNDPSANPVPQRVDPE